MAEVNIIKVDVCPDGRLDVRNAAKYCGLSYRTLNTKRTRGGGPVYVKVSSRIFYYRTDLDAWMKTARMINTSEQANKAEAIKPKRMK